MRQKGVVFSTRLDISACASVFKGTGEAANGGIRRVLGTSARLAGAGNKLGFYTPNFDSVWAGVNEQPDFMVGVNVLKFGPGIAPGSGPGDGTHVHMYVKDKGNARHVQLVAQHGMTDARFAAKLVTRFLDAFRAADHGLIVTETNI